MGQENQSTMQLIKYKCYKEVEAAQILGISLTGELGFGENNFYQPSVEWLNKHSPEVGGYFVKYKDGYLSYSPAKAFEEGYSKNDNN